MITDLVDTRAATTERITASLGIDLLWEGAAAPISVASANRAFSNVDEAEKNMSWLDRPRASALHRARAQRAVLSCLEGGVVDRPEDEMKVTH
ncbi:MAG: hypothetical protein A2Y61_01765 [Chloroflexi bacterium RBG_13_60_13]|nr:MAG: hypothetical protein A2Y61_01765 [Chloroflexi bacterium RBG_13_60_13]